MSEKLTLEINMKFRSHHVIHSGHFELEQVELVSATKLVLVILKMMKNKSSCSNSICANFKYLHN